MPAKTMENPVTITTMQSNSGWGVTFGLADFRVKEVFFRLDGQGEFKSTGHLPSQNQQTGTPMVNTFVPLPGLTPGDHTVELLFEQATENNYIGGTLTIVDPVTGEPVEFPIRPY